MNFSAKLLILLACLQCSPAFADSIDAAQARVQASHAALQAAELDYRQNRARGSLSPGEAADYRSYIARLRRGFFRACDDLASFSPHWFGFKTPCPPRVPSVSRPATVDQATEQTPDERVTAVAQDLDKALSEFDEMLLREQERVKAATPPQSASAGASGSAGGSGADGEGAFADSGEGSGASADTASATASAEGADAGRVATAAGSGGGAAPPGRAGSQGGGQRRSAQGVPPDIPDRRDDDVVARQLREAAQAERDPQLRARLWDEYRRYKRGTP